MKKIFFTSIKENHPAFLAVIENRIFLLKRLIQNNPHFRMQKGRFDHTLLFLAKYLDRQECLKILLPQPLSFNESYGLSHLIFEQYSYLEKTLDVCRRVRLNFTKEKLWLAAFYKQAVIKSIHPEFRISNIDSYLGKGVFAIKNIPKSTFLGEYTGIVRKRRRKILKDNVYCLRYPVGFDKGKRYVIDASERGNHTRFINHSYEPNAVLQSAVIEGLTRMIFISTRAIKQGEQVTFDYGTLFWKQEKKTPIKL